MIMSLVDSEGNARDCVVGKAAMLSCVDGLEKKIDVMLRKIDAKFGVPDSLVYRNSDKYRYDIFSDFLSLIRASVHGYKGTILDYSDFARMAQTASEDVLSKSKYDEDWEYASECMEGVTHYLENRCTGLECLQCKDNGHKK